MTAFLLSIAYYYFLGLITVCLLGIAVFIGLTIWAACLGWLDGRREKRKGLRA